MIARVMIAGAAALLLWGAPGASADEIAAGQVVKVDRREIYVNLGDGRGVEDGARIRFKRPITLRHPVTRRPVTDWLPIGDGTVTDTGSSLARVELESGLLAQVKVGDVAEIYVVRAESAPPPTAPPPTPTPPTPDRPMPEVDAETAQVLQVWRAISGASLEARIAAWEGWLATHGSSRYAAAIRDDVAVLRSTQEAMRPEGKRTAPPLHVEHAQPRYAAAGVPVPLAFVLAEPAAVTAATLHARTIGQATFRRVELTREHAVYLRGALPADLAVAPGVEYFVEAIRADGASAEAYASAAQPATIAIAPPPLVSRFTQTRKRTRLSVIGSYLDFATFDKRKNNMETVDRTDRFAQTEIDILYRLDGLLYGVRAGFGAYGGKGGFRNRFWTEASPAPITGFQYGYAEAELRFPVPRGPAIGLSGRFIAGVGRTGFGVGAAARLRLGDPDLTNLSAGVSSVEDLGFLTDLRLETWPGPKTPVGISVGVTDQPGNGDLGVRLATEVGYRVRSWVTPTARVSWQGRSAAHAGVGGGLGVVFDW